MQLLSSIICQVYEINTGKWNKSNANIVPPEYVIIDLCKEANIKGLVLVEDILFISLIDGNCSIIIHENNIVTAEDIILSTVDISSIVFFNYMPSVQDEYW